MPRRLNLDLPNMPPELVTQVEDTINGWRNAGETIVVNNTNSFSNWLKGKNPQLYNKVKPYLDMIFEAVKSALELTHSFFL